MELLKFHAFLTFFVVVTAHSASDYDDWPDGKGLSKHDKTIIKEQFTELARDRRMTEVPAKILRTMITYVQDDLQNVTNYNVVYLGVGGALCSGRVSYATREYVKNRRLHRCKNAKHIAKCIPPSDNEDNGDQDEF